MGIGKVIAIFWAANDPPGLLRVKDLGCWQNYLFFWGTHLLMGERRILFWFVVLLMLLCHCISRICLIQFLRAMDLVHHSPAHPALGCWPNYLFIQGMLLLMGGKKAFFMFVIRLTLAWHWIIHVCLLRFLKAVSETRSVVLLPIQLWSVTPFSANSVQDDTLLANSFGMALTHLDPSHQNSCDGGVRVEHWQEWRVL